MYTSATDALSVEFPNKRWQYVGKVITMSFRSTEEEANLASKQEDSKNATPTNAHTSHEVASVPDPKQPQRGLLPVSA